ncbi:hypothetical protein [Liquorilactobacillus satsumensis]|uniref:hypothetical protein n=1 Tax=Liquorilactobacillus satsumensis TaxID=259059 RepID=UPI0039ED99E4
MKAYILSDVNNDDLGNLIGFGNTAKEVKKKYFQVEPFEDTPFIDFRVIRYPDFDDCENYTPEQMALKQWHEGWWFFQDVPDEATATDEEFLKAYAKDNL